MNANPHEGTLARIDAALARIEVALDAAPTGGAPGWQALATRNAALRTAVAGAIGRIDALIADAEAGDEGEDDR